MRKKLNKMIEMEEDIVEVLVYFMSYILWKNLKIFY